MGIKKSFLIIIFLLAAVFFLLFYLQGNFWDSSAKLRVVFFDVGQGDAALIITPQGQAILVDGGEGEKVLAKLGNHLPFYQKKIDIMILSHPHADHLEGLVAVLRKYQVGQIYYSGVPHTTPAFFEWLRLIKEEEIPMQIIKGRRTIKLDSGVELKFLYPDHDLTREDGEGNFSPPARGGDQEGVGEESESPEGDSLNNTSIVFKLIYDQTSFLFTGDAETPVEEELLSSPLQSTVLKVAHHGSHSSTSEEFLRAVQPQIAIISVGRDNDFGHPHRRTLRRLERFGSRIYRTDQDSDVIIDSDGKRARKL